MQEKDSLSSVGFLSVLLRKTNFNIFENVMTIFFLTLMKGFRKRNSSFTPFYEENRSLYICPT